MILDVQDAEALIEQSSNNHLENWLRLYRPTIFYSKKEAKSTITNTTKRITQYFKTTEGYHKRHRQRERIKAEKSRHSAYGKKYRNKTKNMRPIGGLQQNITHNILFRMNSF